MKRLLWCLLAVLCLCVYAGAQTCVKVNGIAGRGGGKVVTSGTNSTNTAEVTFPSSTLTVYATGTTNPSSIFSDSSCSVVKSNPFTVSGTDASFGFYIAPARIDLRFSGTGITTPFTISDYSAIGVGTGTDDPPGAFYWAVNYASCNAAITAMGTTVPVRLIFSEQLACTTATVTPNIQLQFVGNGRMVVAASNTVTIQGSITASPSQFIFDTTASGAVVSFSGNTSLTAIYPQWWGVVSGVSATNSAALQSAVDAMPPRSKMLWTSGLLPRTTVPLRIWGKGEITIEHVAPSGFYSDSQTGIDYRGADGTAAVQVYNSYSNTWKGINISINHDSKVAQVGIDVDQFAVPVTINGNVLSAGSVNSANTFAYFNIYAQTNGVNTAGIRFAYTSPNNVEAMTIDHVKVIIDGPNALDPTVATRGTAFKIGGGGGGGNTFGEKFLSCQWVQASFGIEATNASYLVEDGLSGSATVDFKGFGTITIERFRSEQQLQFFVGGGSVTLINNELASNGLWDLTKPVVSIAGTSSLSMINNTYNDEACVPVDASVGATALYSGLGNVWPSSASPPVFTHFTTATELSPKQRLALLVTGDTLNPYGNAIRLNSLGTISNLAGLQFGNGTVTYVVDAAPGSDGPTSGNGAFVVRRNGAWQALGTNSTTFALGAFGVPGAVPGMVEQEVTIACGFGDRVLVGAPVTVGANYILSAYVSSANRVRVRWTQVSGAAADPNAAGGNYVITLWR